MFNTTLTNLAGLDGLTSVYGDGVTYGGVAVMSNPALLSMRGLDALVACSSVTVADAASLQSFDGMQALRGVSYFAVTQAPSLRTLVALQAALAGDTTVGLDATGLTDCSGLELVTGSELISIQDNPALTSLAALQSLTMAESLLIDGNGALSTLAGLESLTQISVGLSITGNGALVDLSALQQVRSLPSNPLSIVIDNDPLLCCPSYTFFVQSAFSAADIACNQCFQITAFSPLMVPSSGGVTLMAPFIGAISSNPVPARFRFNGTAGQSVTGADTSCTVEATAASVNAGTLLCLMSPLLLSGAVVSLPSVASFEVSVGGSWFPTNLSTSFVTFATYANISAASAAANPRNETSTEYHTTEAPGVPLSRVADAAATAITILAIATSIGGAVLLCGLLALCACSSLRAHSSRTAERLDKLFVTRTQTSTSSLSFLLRESSAEGGFFTVAAVILVVGLLAAYLTEVAMDNTLVLKSVDPTPSNVIVPSDYEAQVTFEPVRQFQQHVPATAGPIPCEQWFELTASSFSSHGGFACTFDPVADAVTVVWRCVQCTQALVAGSISVSAVSVNAFTRSISFAFSSTDYFRGESRVSGTMLAGIDRYFKASPSVIDLSAMSTNFTQFSEATRTGKLTKLIATKPGAAITAAQFKSSSGGVSFRFDVAAQSSWFVIQLTQKTSPIAVLAQVFAIIGGVVAVARIGLAGYVTLTRSTPNTDEPQPCVVSAQPSVATLSDPLLPVN